LSILSILLVFFLSQEKFPLSKT